MIHKDKGIETDQERILKIVRPDFYVSYLPAIIVAVIAVVSIVCAGIFLGHETAMTVGMIATTIPAMILLIYIYRSDRIEPEPAGLLFMLFIIGMLVSLPAMGIETLTGRISSGIVSVVCIAAVEEICKYAVLRLCTWKHSAFNYRFDGVVYGVTVAIARR